MSHIPEDPRVAKLLFATIAEFEREFPTAKAPSPVGEGFGWKSAFLDFDIYFFPKQTNPKMSVSDTDVLVAVEIKNSDRNIHKVFGVAGTDSANQLVKLFTVIRIFAEESSPWLPSIFKEFSP